MGRKKPEIVINKNAKILKQKTISEGQKSKSEKGDDADDLFKISISGDLM